MVDHTDDPTGPTDGSGPPDPGDPAIGATSGSGTWHKVAEPGELADGRVRTAQAGHRSVALTHCKGRFGALDNHCPNQGGPLGEGSIEKGWLRCPWHGRLRPHDGTPPPGFRRPGGVPRGHATTASTCTCPTPSPRAHGVRRAGGDDGGLGVTHVFGMVGHSNLGFADALRRQEEQGRLTFVGIRHEGAAAFAASAFAKLTGRPAACFGIAGPGSTNLLTGLYDAKVDRAPVLAISGQVPSKVLGRGAFQDLDLPGAFADVATYHATVLPDSAHAELMTSPSSTPCSTGCRPPVIPDEVQVLPRPPSPRQARPAACPT
jgi:hypothetical protein